MYPIKEDPPSGESFLMNALSNASTSHASNVNIHTKVYNGNEHITWHCFNHSKVCSRNKNEHVKCFKSHNWLHNRLFNSLKVMQIQQLITLNLSKYITQTSTNTWHCFNYKMFCTILLVYDNTGVNCNFLGLQWSYLLIIF